MLSNYFTPEQKPSDAIGLLKTKSACNLIVLKIPKFLILIYIDLARGKSKALADILTGYSSKKSADQNAFWIYAFYASKRRKKSN